MDGLDFNEIMYADDTALITNNINAMNRFLAKVEDCAAYFGLKFNKTECVAFNFHVDGKTKFKDRSEVPTPAETVYLGASLSKTHNTKKEISTKIGSCFATMKKLDVFWNNAKCPAQLKILVFLGSKISFCDLLLDLCGDSEIAYD